MPPMRILIESSKILILALLSFALVISWYSANINVTGVDSVSDVTKFRATESVWTSLSRELTLDHKVQTSQVKAEIRKLLADQSKLYGILKAAAPYIYYIHKQTQARGLPGELALIPVIESEFNPNDHSNKGATGLWQLMPGTAHELGVKVQSGYDGRRNVVASTKAALAYFNDLGNMFDGNWYLAIAAYNAGQGRIESAIRHSGSHSFWNLNSLPRETKYYVPKLMAVAELVKHPEKYGIQLPPVLNKPYFSEIKVNSAVNLSHVAAASSINVETLHKLNPDNNHGKLPTNKGTVSLLVPVNKVPIVKEKLAGKIVSA